MKLSTIQSTNTTLLLYLQGSSTDTDPVRVNIWLAAMEASAQTQHVCLSHWEYFWQLNFCQCSYTIIGTGTWGGTITPSAGWQTYSARQNKCWRPSNQAAMNDKKRSLWVWGGLRQIFGLVNVWVSLQEWDIFPFIGSHHYIKFYILPIHTANENSCLLLLLLDNQNVTFIPPSGLPFHFILSKSADGP